MSLSFDCQVTHNKSRWSLLGSLSPDDAELCLPSYFLYTLCFILIYPLPQNMLPRVLPFFFNVSSSFSLKFTHIDDSLLVAILHPGDIWQYLKPFLIVMTGVGKLLRHLVVEIKDVDKHPTMLRTAPYNCLIPNVNRARSWNCDIHIPHCICPKGLNSFDLVLIPHLFAARTFPFDAILTLQIKPILTHYHRSVQMSNFLC